MFTLGAGRGLEDALVFAHGGEGQRGAEEIYGVAVGPGTEARVEDVVGARHAFDDVPGEVGVDAVCGDVDGVAFLEDEVVHCEEGDEVAGVCGTVLGGEAGEERGNVGGSGELGGGGFFEGGVNGGNFFVGKGEDFVDDGF